MDPTKTTPAIACVRCGAQNAADAARCGACGEALLGEAVTVPAPQAPATPGSPSHPSGGDDPWIGRTVGPYRIERAIGRGGMGVVYRAADERLGRPVALKFLSQALAKDAAARARFHREARAASALDHPNIGTVYDAGEQDGQLYLAIAFYEGETLDARVARGPLSVEEAVGIAKGVAAGLGAAHAASVVHRDVKPSNIFLTKAGAVKVLDFGLAKLAPDGGAGTGEDLAITRSGEIMGTPSYMSPEQVAGRAVDHRSDVWSLGVTLYEMLAGARPFPGTSAMEVGTRILTAEPRPIGAIRDGVPPHLVRLVERMLAKRPDERPGSMAAVIAALDGAAIAPLPTRARSRRTPILVAAGVLGIASAGGIVAWRAHRGAVAQTALGPRRTIAVLGFKDLAGRPEAAWISPALVEMLGTELAAGDGLRPIPGENVARMKVELRLADADSLAPDTLARVRDNTGAELALLGSYLATDVGGTARLRLDLRLQRTDTGELVRAISEDGTLADLPAIVTRAASDLRRALALAPLSTEQAAQARRALPDRPAAARAYAEGLARLRLGDLRGAREQLAAAVAEEPQKPLLHAALAEALFQLSDERGARAEARRALDLAAGLDREERLLVEASYRRIAHEYDRVVEIREELFRAQPDDVERGLALALAQDVKGDQAAAISTLAALRKLPPPAGADPRIAIAEARATVADARRRAALAAEGAAEAKRRGATILAANARRIEGWAYLLLADTAKAEAAAAEALAVLSQAGIPWAAADALLLQADCAEQRGDPDARERLLQRRLALAEQGGDRRGKMDTLLRLAELSARTGRAAEAIRRIAAAEALAAPSTEDPLGDPTWLAHAARRRAFVEERRGDLAAAEAACRDAWDAYDRLGPARPFSGQPATKAIRARVRLAEGALADAARQFADVEEWAAQHAPEWLPATRRALARIDLDQGRAVEAAARAHLAARDDVAGRTDQFLAPLERAETALLLAEALLAQGPEKKAESRRALDAARTLAGAGRPGGYPDVALRVETGLCALSARLDETTREDALKRLAAAAERADKLGFPGEALAARLARAETLLPLHPAEARAALTALEEQATARGFGRLARRASALLGEAPPEAAPTPVPGDAGIDTAHDAANLPPAP